MPKETSSTQKPELPKSAAAMVGETTPLMLKLSLGREVTDGRPHGTLGVRAVAVDADLAQALGIGDRRGALVTEVDTTTLGAAGLLPGDIIETLDGTAIGDADKLGEVLSGLAPERQISVGVQRTGAGAQDLKQRLVDRAKEGNVGAAAVLGRFYAQGLVIGVFGTLVGVLLGVTTSVILGSSEVIKLNPEIYFIDHLPVVTDVGDVLLTVAASLVIATLATLYPSMQAARLYPIEAIRHE